ncbi:MAG TPA: hypothetical protein VFD00_12755 [Thermoclostridium sp.]|nr:hypothetical protein [Thermoclostridium sp.]
MQLKRKPCPILTVSVHNCCGQTAQSDPAYSNDLPSNIGTELYNDGSNEIYVSWIDKADINSGGYSIGFRSSGQYSINNVTLVSGIRHNTAVNSFTDTMTAKMIAKYNDKIYCGEIFGYSGLNFKDGDDFSFYIFPSQTYDEEISLNENGVVELTVTNLYKNIWTKK